MFIGKYFAAAGVVLGLSAMNASAGDCRPCDPYKIARWVHILQFDRDEDHREDAAEDLGKYGDPGVIPVLAHAAAYDCDKSVRKEAGKAIARIRSRFPAACRPVAYVQPAPVQYVQPQYQPQPAPQQFQPQPVPQAPLPQPEPQPQFQPQPPAPQSQPMPQPLPQPEAQPQGSSSGAAATYVSANGYRWDAQRRVWVKVQPTYAGR